MGETVYAVFREGVYRHECGGVFTTLELASACADDMAARDVDDYHEYRVVPFVLDRAGDLDDTHAAAGWRSPTISEAAPAYVSRGRPKEMGATG